MFIQHPHEAGIQSFRDQSYQERGTSLGARTVSYALSLKSIDEEGNTNTDKSIGDILGSVLVKGGERGMASWFHACPAVKTANGFLPIRDRSFSADQGYLPFSAAVYAGAEVPNGIPGIVLCATKETGEQELLFFGSAASGGPAKMLLAPNRNGEYTFGTDVHDLDSEGKVDMSTYAKLQSAWKVMKPSYAPVSGSTSAPAYFFNNAGQGVNVGLAPGGGALVLNPQQNNGNGNVTVGILPDGAGGINITDNNPDTTPDKIVSVGVGNPNGGLNIQGGGPPNVG